MKNTIFALTLTALTAISAQAQIGKKIVAKSKDVTGTITPSNGNLTNEEVVSGLKEALTRGAKTSAEKASVTDGFYKNALVFIQFPPEAMAMRDRLIKLGLEKKVTEFEQSMNRAAEEAAKDAFDIFSQAVKDMSVGDGFAILNGSDSSATHYLREKTTASLTVKFAPIVKAAMDKVNVTAYWTPLATTYNKLPGVTKQNPDLEAYVTSKAIDGLMKLIREQEAKIRQDPAAQVSELLQKVFGKKG